MDPDNSLLPETGENATEKHHSSLESEKWRACPWQMLQPCKMFKQDVYLFLSHVAPNLLKIHVQKFLDTSRRHGSPTPRTLLIRLHNLPSVSKVSTICTFVLANQEIWVPESYQSIGWDQAFCYMPPSPSSPTRSLGVWGLKLLMYEALRY